jgi:hypothetical protein
VDGVRAYLRENVEQAGSFGGFLESVGTSTLFEQRRRAKELVSA